MDNLKRVKHSFESSSAEQPVLKRRRVRLCARDGNTRVKKSRIRASAVDDTTKVAFISCGLGFIMEINEDRARLQKIVTELFHLGCLMFAVTFEQTGNTSLVEEDLRETLSEVAQTSVHSRTAKNSITLWTQSFGSCYLSKFIESKAGTHLPTPIELKMTGTFFDTKAGRLLVMSTVWPEMDTWTIAKALNDFLGEADKSVQAVFVGGALQCPVPICENVLAKFYSAIDFVVTGSQTVFVHTLQREGARSTPIHIHDDISSLLVNLPLAPRRQTSFSPPLPPDPPPPPPLTPLYDHLLNSLRHHVPQLLAYISEKCFRGELLTKNFFGETLERPMRLSVKMEELLDVCQARRQLHVDYLRKLGDPRCSAEQPEADNLIVFNDNDMVRIMNTWRKDVVSYMRPATLWQYHRDLKFNPEKVHSKSKSIHSLHLFQISGCKFLVYAFIRMPVLSECAEQPVMDELLQDYEDHKRSEEYKGAVEQSKKRNENQLKCKYAGAGACVWSRLPAYG